jgi:8-oxo-dGTP diphosphatase
MDNPPKHYRNAPKHLVSVDCIIFGFDEGELKILIAPRRVDPLTGQWSLMGGFVGENESMDDASARVLYSLTGLKSTYLEQVQAYGAVNRDTGARVISVAYYALINTNEYDGSLAEKHEAKWFDINKIPPLVFDHKKMVKDALNLLRRRTLIQPVGFELLPKKFTLPQLQQLYEAIHSNPIDKRNFRNQILSHKILEKFPEKDKSSSRKGAFLYGFDKKKYKAFVSAGFSFKMNYVA